MKQSIINNYFKEHYEVLKKDNVKGFNVNQINYRSKQLEDVYQDRIESILIELIDMPNDIDIDSFVRDRLRNISITNKHLRYSINENINDDVMYQQPYNQIDYLIFGLTNDMKKIFKKMQKKGDFPTI